MRRLHLTSIGQLFRSSRPGFTSSSGMSDAIIPIRAIEFTSSGKWKYAQAPHNPYSPSRPSTSLTLVTWNVDFMMPNASLRLTAALDYLQYRVFPGLESGQPPPPCIILLQEIQAGDFGTLLGHPWVREWFAVVPGSANDGWPRGATYGTVTLVARNESMPLAGSTCVHFGGSRMARNALVTDVVLRGGAGGGRVLRVVNTHLESLPEGTPQRVVQMGVIAGLLKKTGMLGGIVGGDMNAIAVSDETLAEENGLTDAWEEERGRVRSGGDHDDDVGAAEEEEDDDDDGGVTWGYQPRTRYPPGRLDRILYTKNEDGDLKIKDVRRIAVGLEIPGGVGGWVSDHYGLACLVQAEEAQGRNVSLEAEA